MRSKRKNEEASDSTQTEPGSATAEARTIRQEAERRAMEARAIQERLRSMREEDYVTRDVARLLRRNQ